MIKILYERFQECKFTVPPVMLLTDKHLTIASSAG